MRASYDTTAMRGCADQLDAATTALTALTRQLTALPRHAVPDVVDGALDRLGRRGVDLIADIVEESHALVDGLRQAAHAYDEVDQALMRTFQ
ncbi:hypothetical protein [Dactylosporangium sp. NPDC006015]|uniref:hypothetical protein n=1 Tax=Dactylosporangium sp. NPDC006015 TaxID=3154576 RepID=UPI0033A50875